MKKAEELLAKGYAPVYNDETGELEGFNKGNNWIGIDLIEDYDIEELVIG